MSNSFLRVAVTGVTGRMGKEIIRCFFDYKKRQFCANLVLGAAITRSNSSFCGTDIGIFMHHSASGVVITDDIELVRDDFDVLVDFTAPDISIEYLKFCVNYNKNIVIGTTGFNDMHNKFIINASKKIGIVFSSNFSIGIALVSKLLRTITRIIGNTSDINIIETHHNKKRDIPSGTALMLQNIIVNTLRADNTDGTVLNSNSNLVTKCTSSSNFNDGVAIHSIRAGDIIGEHIVSFTSIGECLEFTHKALSRSIFADGALHAAIWLGRKKIGLFDISDTLEMDCKS